MAFGGALRHAAAPEVAAAMSVDELLAALWRGYVSVTPQALRIHELLAARGETPVNDHVALRTFGRPRVGLEVLARPFLELGWAPRDDYRFEEKHLVARAYQPPRPGLPKVFISELLVEALSASARALVDALVAQVPGEGEVLWSGRPWKVTQATYRALLAESEYAAWVAAFGFRANHFTVDVGQLTTFGSLEALDDFLLQHGFRLNEAGGRIKGSPSAYLEQSSTLADEVEVAFDDGALRVPSCYYEFARRYPLPDGTRFEGFVPASANRLFESTHTSRR